MAAKPVTLSIALLGCLTKGLYAEKTDERFDRRGRKKAFIELCEAYNLSMASVIGMIVRACVESRKLPFDFIEDSKKAGSK